MIHKSVGVEPVLKPGSGGIFDVVVDGELIFSKHERGHFPDEQEILDELQP